MKYFVPNLLTSCSIAFGVLAVQAAARGRPREAAFWIIYGVMVDKLDGLAARALRASSESGVQFDSLADLVAFGVAPATLVFTFFSSRPALGWADGWRAVALAALAVGYVVCAAARLARFNVHTGEPEAGAVYFGTPTTFAGGMIAALFATLLKYGDPAWSDGWPSWEPRLFAAMRVDAAMQHLPWLLGGAGLAMVSTLRVPKLGRPARPLHWVMLGFVAVCYVLGFARLLPEVLAATAVGFFFIVAGWNALSPDARAARPPRCSRAEGRGSLADRGRGPCGRCRGRGFDRRDPRADPGWRGFPARGDGHAPRQGEARLEGMETRLGRVENGLNDLGNFMRQIALDQTKYERFHPHRVGVLEKDIRQGV